MIMIKRLSIVIIVLMTMIVTGAGAWILNVPVDVDTSKEKVMYLSRIKYLIWEQHNAIGTWYREGGLTQDEYDNGICIPSRAQCDKTIILIPKLKKVFPYSPELTQAQWSKFKSGIRELRSSYASKLSNNLWSIGGDETVAADLNRDIE